VLTTVPSVQEFKDWILAFEFKLNLFDIPLKPVTTEGSGLVKLHQLILDASTAKLVHNRSSLAGRADTRSPDITRKLNGTLEQTFIGCYIKAFVGAQHLVLSTPSTATSTWWTVDKLNTQS